MSRGKGGVKLPQSIQKELGIELNHARNRRHAPTSTRHEQPRRANRVEKREDRGGRSVTQQRDRHPRVKSRGQKDEESGSEFGGFLSDTEQQTTSTHEAKPRPSAPHPRSILKRTQSIHADSSSDDEPSSSHRALSPEIVLDASSRSYKDRLAEDEDEIAALEKRLGLKKNKNPSKSFDEDGLGDLLDGLDGEGESRKRKREETEWLEQKRMRREAATGLFSEDTAIGEGREGSGSGDGFDEDFEEEGDSVSQVGNRSKLNEGSQARQQLTTRVRENPYVPPVAPSPSATKYVPPSLRRGEAREDENHERLKRQVLGQLNKLSEANLISILNEIESLYRTHPRQDVTSALIDLLLSLFCNRSILQNTSVLLHAAFSSAVYKIIGNDFGAELVAQLVDRFQQYHHDTSNVGKEALNLLSFLSHLFTFHLISSTLIYSHINLLLTPLTEANTELLLRVIRDCGPQLRTDDSSALKSIVSQTQTAALSLLQPVSVRTQVMLDTITDLKNNKMRESNATSGLTREHITRLRKTLGSLNNTSRTLRATEPLRLTLEDLRNSERKGKWWLVGASWRGSSPPATATGAAHSSSSSITPQPTSPTSPPGTRPPNYTAIAQTLSLTTPIQQSILTALLTSPNADHAFIALTKLRLKQTQIPQIPHVLQRCCAMESSFNKFYPSVALKLCTGEHAKRFRKAFEFSFWSFFRRLHPEDGMVDGSSHDSNEYSSSGLGAADNVNMSEILHTAHLYAHLIYSPSPSSGLTLTILRPIDLPLLHRSSKACLFAELLLVQILILCHGREGDVRRVVGALVEARHIVGRVGLFLRSVVRRSDLVGAGGGDGRDGRGVGRGKDGRAGDGEKGKERGYVKKGVKIAGRVLEGLNLEDEEEE